MISGLKYRNVACFNQVSKTQYGVIITMNMTRGGGWEYKSSKTK